MAFPVSGASRTRAYPNNIDEGTGAFRLGLKVIRTGGGRARNLGRCYVDNRLAGTGSIC